MFLAGCTAQEHQTLPNSFAPKKIRAEGRILPFDIASARVVPVDESTIRKLPVGQLPVVPTNTNVTPAGEPRVIAISETDLGEQEPPRILSPVITRKPAGRPEAIIAKDAVGKDHNSHNFTCFKRLQGLKNDFIYSVAEDHDGNIWTGVSEGGICVYDGKSIRQLPRTDSFPIELALCIFPDRAGNVWFGSLDQGAMRYDGRRFTHFDTRSGLPSNTVRGIAEDRDGNIWLATNGGAVKYDGEYFTIFTEQQGLSGSEVVSLLEDKSGTLWFGANSGLNRLINNSAGENNAAQNLYFKSYTYEDGFLRVSCRGNSLVQARDGAIWIGTVERLTVLHPEGELPDTIPPNIQLTSIDLFNEQIDWSGFESNKDTFHCRRRGKIVARNKGKIDMYFVEPNAG